MMTGIKKIKTALISVYYKDGLDEIIRQLNKMNIEIISTGGTQKFISELGIPVKTVEELTSYPSILGGRVKTLHPKIFGGILARRELKEDLNQLEEYQIPEIDLVIVDLYPFEETVASGAKEQDIIEKIDIGGISLIRAAAKNFKDVLIISSKSQYSQLLSILSEKNGETTLPERKEFAFEAFNNSSHYDTAITGYFNSHFDKLILKLSCQQGMSLRYGENPHQKGIFFGDLDKMFNKLNGKEISYNNILDIDAAVNLIEEFSETTFAILKHNNACGIASREKLIDAWKDALAGDPVSAFGGILITNVEINLETAIEIDKLFYEVLIAPSFAPEALELLKKKTSRILLKKKKVDLPKIIYRTALNGILAQERDISAESREQMKTITKKSPTSSEYIDLEFANKIVKHTKSNTIVLAKNKQLCASGTGQTSRVDALRQAVVKAKSFNFDLQGSVMSSDAFFPFPDCVEIAFEAGITSVIQPGGSKNDQASIDFCDKHNMSMVLTGIRHFKH